MTPQELKASILQRAIQGKLVEQRPEEGTGEELYQQIQKEKAELIKAKIIKKEKLQEAFGEAELPFEVPETWKWVHLNEIAVTGLGKTLNKTKDTGEICRYLCSINVYWDGIKLDTVKEACFTEDDKEKYLLQKGDLLICEGGDAGRCAIWNADETMYYQNALHRVRFYGNILPEYYRNVFEFFKLSGMIKRHCKGETIKHLVQSELYSIPMPLPPLAEQHRIVAKIEELLPYIDRYEKAWTKLEEFNKKFPGDMQKSILQTAIQGKLVEQRPEEGTGEELYQQIQKEKEDLIKAKKIKKEKPLPEITEDEVPFEIPESWKWVRLAELGTFSSGKTPNMSEPKFWNNGTVQWFTSKDMKKKYLTESEMKITSLAAEGMTKYPAGTLLMVVRSGILKRMLPLCILMQESTVNQDIKAYRLYDLAISDYVYYMLKGLEAYILENYRKQVTTVDSLKFDEFSREMLVPLPPLAEQKRIVAKLEELLPLCDGLR